MAGPAAGSIAAGAIPARSGAAIAAIGADRGAQLEDLALVVYDEDGFLGHRTPRYGCLATVGSHGRPATPRSSLSRGDARRLAPGGATAAAIEVAELAFVGRQMGPVSLPVGPANAAASILGADLLGRLAVVAPDGDRLRLTPR